MKRGLAAVLASGMFFCYIPAASAGNWNFGINAGLAYGTGDLVDTMQTDFAWSLYGEYDLSPGFSIQGRYGRHVHDLSSDFTEFAGATAPVGLDLNGTFTINEFIMDAKVSVPFANKMRWFFLGGVGAYIWDLDFGPLQTTEGVTPRGADGTDFGLIAGTGLEYGISPDVSVGAEVDYNYIFGDFDEGYLIFSGAIIFHF